MSVAATPLDIVTPVTLEGPKVRLEPIRREHAGLFWDVAKDALEDIFRWIPYPMRTLEDFLQVVDKAFAEQDRGESVVFTTVERGTGRVIGSTRFMNIDRVNRRVEIGSTWIAPAWQRTAVNTSRSRPPQHSCPPVSVGRSIGCNWFRWRPRGHSR